MLHRQQHWLSFSAVPRDMENDLNDAHSVAGIASNPDMQFVLFHVHVCVCVCLSV